VIRVVVVDDSATARELIVAILNNTPEIQVIGEAADGAQGVEMVAQLRPDVVTMDINMPVMDGYEATRRIMETAPTPTVVVTSVSNEEIIHRGLDILLVGAIDIVEKPSGLTERDYQTISEELVNKVMTVSQIRFTKPA
jgi:two-component system, chemotaxis family, protein-glutamate methylesterase/glutaminase